MIDHADLGAAQDGRPLLGLDIGVLVHAHIGIAVPALPLENLRETVIGVNKDSAHRNLPLFGYSGRNAGKCKHGVHQDIGAGRAIRLGCVLELVVADAVLAGHEHHRSRNAGVQVAGVVAGA